MNRKQVWISCAAGGIKITSSRRNTNCTYYTIYDRELQMGGQQSVNRNICHITVDVAPTTNKLPHTLQDTQTISVK